MTLLCTDGIMKYYVASDERHIATGTGLKGIFDLTGARMNMLEDSPNMLEIILPQEHGNDIVLEAPSEEKVTAISLKILVFVNYSSNYLVSTVIIDGNRRN